MHTLSDGRQRGWYHIDNALLDEYGPRIGAIGVAVYNVIVRRARETERGRVSWPSYSAIAAAVAISRPTAIATVKALIAYGLIGSETVYAEGKRAANHYTVETILPADTGKAGLPVKDVYQSGGKAGLPVKDVYQSSSKGDLLVKEIYQSEGVRTGKGDLLVKDVDPNKTLRERDLTPVETNVSTAPTPKYAADFETWWAACPPRMRRCGKGETFRIWQRLGGARPPLDALLRILALQAGSDDWRREGGKYIPMATTYLAKARWEAEVPPAVVAANGRASPATSIERAEAKVERIKGTVESDIARYTAMEANGHDTGGIRARHGAAAAHLRPGEDPGGARPVLDGAQGHG